MLTKAFTEEWNNQPMFVIKKVDHEGQPIMEFDKSTGEKQEAKPILKFGIKKAKAMATHGNELIAFIEDKL